MASPFPVGKTIGIDPTTLEGTAAMRSIARTGHHGKLYRGKLLRGPNDWRKPQDWKPATERALRRRPKTKGSNAKRVNPHDPEPRDHAYERWLCGGDDATGEGLTDDHTAQSSYKPTTLANSSESSSVADSRFGQYEYSGTISLILARIRLAPSMNMVARSSSR